MMKLSKILCIGVRFLKSRVPIQIRKQNRCLLTHGITGKFYPLRCEKS